jgi:hypothetical protein
MGEFESFMISGILVQPSTTASQPRSFMRVNDPLEIGDRFRLENAVDQLIEDDAVDLLGFFLVGTGAGVLPWGRGTARLVLRQRVAAE